MKIICIFPKDKSTNFLDVIYDCIPNTEMIIKIRIDSDATTKQAKDALREATSDTFIIYMGHGTDSDLRNYNEKIFIDDTEYYLFEGKSVFCISCYSSTLLNRIPNIKAYVGFGNIPSEDVELITYGINEGLKEISDIFNEKISLIIKRALSSQLREIGNINLDELYFILKLLINKEISTTILSKDKYYREISSLLYDIKYNLTLKSIS